MSLTLRSTKGSPLTFNEMDGNLTYLEGLAQEAGGYQLVITTTALTSSDYFVRVGGGDNITITFPDAVAAGASAMLFFRTQFGAGTKTFASSSGTQIRLLGSATLEANFVVSGPSHQGMIFISDGVDWNQISIAQEAGGPVIPPTAKLYFPDIQGILGDIVYILENDPVSPIDPVFDNFLDPRIINAASIDPMAPQLFLVEGFYRDVLSDPPQFNYNLNIAFNGIVNNEALDSGEEYSATKVSSFLNVDGNGDVIAAGLNELFIDSDISFNYRWEEQMGIYTISLIASNITGSATIAALIEIDSTTGGAGATYDIQVLGTGN